MPKVSWPALGKKGSRAVTLWAGEPFSPLPCARASGAWSKATLAPSSLPPPLSGAFFHREGLILLLGDHGSAPCAATDALGHMSPPGLSFPPVMQQVSLCLVHPAALRTISILASDLCMLKTTQMLAGSHPHLSQGEARREVCVELWCSKTKHIPHCNIDNYSVTVKQGATDSLCSMAHHAVVWVSE